MTTLFWFGSWLCVFIGLITGLVVWSFTGLALMVGAIAIELIDDRYI